MRVCSLTVVENCRALTDMYPPHPPPEIMSCYLRIRVELSISRLALVQEMAEFVVWGSLKQRQIRDHVYTLPYIYKCRISTGVNFNLID